MTPTQFDWMYLAAPGFLAQLQQELQYTGLQISCVRDRLVGVVKNDEQFFRQGKQCGQVVRGWHDGVYHAVWADNMWYNPVFYPIRSIADAARTLRSLQRNWSLVSTAHHRRARLIAEQLPRIAARPLSFGKMPQFPPLGSWTLWDEHTILAATQCSSVFVDGQYHFQEDKEHPPNRAYLKLWEIFSRLGLCPKPRSFCLDLGSSPGGWTWVLAQLGASVFSVDKARLAPGIAALPSVDFCLGSAFALSPEDVGHADWLFCDVACYPDRLFGLVQRFSDYHPGLNMICTIKLSGAADYAVVDKFLHIPGSIGVHLSANKHEVTWVCLGSPENTRLLA